MTLATAAPEPAMAASDRFDACLFLEELHRLYTEPWEIGGTEAAVWLTSVAILVHYDQTTYDYFHEHLSSPEIYRASESLSALGDGVTELAITGLIWLRDPETGRKCLEALAFTGLNVALLKSLLGMARPYLGQGPVFTGPTLDADYAAMPSGHTAAAFAMATVLSAKYPHYKWAFYTLATLIGLSRIYLESHWPSNILAGALTGIYCGQRVLGWEVTILNWRF